MAKLQAPIVLVHGLLGFDELRIHGWTMAEYFPGIAAVLRALGNAVYVPCLPKTDSVVARSTALQAFLNDQVGPDVFVHVIAHSMGGLDARYLIKHLPAGSRVLSLTTVGTPHRGSSFADWGTHNFGGTVCPFLEYLGIRTAAFYDLTRAQCAQFNAATPDDPRVRYFSVAGSMTPTWWTPEWWLPFGILRDSEGANDGLVSVESATWGTFLGVWEADHAALINWPNPLAQAQGRWQDRAPNYVALVQQLADVGF